MEIPLDNTQEVTGSNPVPPTIPNNRQNSNTFLFKDHYRSFKLFNMNSTSFGLKTRP